MKKNLIIAGSLILVYLITYLIFRNSNVETWEKDGKEYVIFPKSKIWIYYLYRPATYLDSKLTTMRFHIGPHPENGY